MRIGIITGEYPPMQGGVGAYTQILAEELTRQGQPVAVLSRVGTVSAHPDIPLNNSIQSWNMNSLRAARKWAHEKRLDIVNVQFQTAAYGMSPWIHFLPHIMNIPVVTTFHDLRYPYLFPKAGWLRRWIVRHLAHASAGVIVTNHEDNAQIHNQPRKMLIPIGSNILKPLPSDFDVNKWRKQSGADDDDLLIAYFGLFNHSKGLDTLLDSLAALCAQGVPARLVMIGGGAGSSDPTNEDYMGSLKARITRHNLEQVVHWTGYLEDEACVGAYLTASDVVALPFTDGASYRRGSLMAAIQYGCAIVTSRPQVEIPTFKNGENMVLVAAGDSKDLERTLHEVYQSPELRQKLRTGAKQLAQHFEWGKIAQDTIAFFEQVREGAT
jgi:glycosyltransferase involved in cell wall biosynthesis